MSSARDWRLAQRRYRRTVELLAEQALGKPTNEVKDGDREFWITRASDEYWTGFAVMYRDAEDPIWHPVSFGDTRAEAEWEMWWIVAKGPKRRWQPREVSGGAFEMNRRRH